jgi:hypothetical protein
MGSLAERAPANGGASAKRRVSKQQSRVTNGKLFSRAITDGRSGWSRRLQDLLSLHIADLGGEDFVSAAERSIIRRIATATVELEWLEQSFALSKQGPSAEALDLYFRGSNSLRRMLESIGLKRVARDVTPDLQTYLAQREEAAAEDDAEVCDADEAAP